MRTIGKRWPRKTSPLGHAQYCDYCGAKFPSWRLRRDSDGLWHCPYHKGRTASELDRANALAAVTYVRAQERPAGNVAGPVVAPDAPGTYEVGPGGLGENPPDLTPPALWPETPDENQVVFVGWPVTIRGTADAVTSVEVTEEGGGLVGEAAVEGSTWEVSFTPTQQGTVTYTVTGRASGSASFSKPFEVRSQAEGAVWWLNATYTVELLYVPLSPTEDYTTSNGRVVSRVGRARKNVVLTDGILVSEGNKPGWRTQVEGGVADNRDATADSEARRPALAEVNGDYVAVQVAGISGGMGAGRVYWNVGVETYPTKPHTTYIPLEVAAADKKKTVAVYFKRGSVTTSGNWSSVIGCSINGDYQSLALQNSDATAMRALFPRATYNSSNAYRSFNVSSDEWAFVAMRWENAAATDSGKARVWKNGAETGTLTTGGGLGTYGLISRVALMTDASCSTDMPEGAAMAAAFICAEAIAPEAIATGGAFDNAWKMILGGY